MVYEIGYILFVQFKRVIIMYKGMWEIMIGIKEILKKYIVPCFVKLTFRFGINKNRFCFIKGLLDNNSKEKPLVLFLPHAGWNTVEQNLPGIVYLKEHFDVCLVVLFPEMQMLCRAKENVELMKIMREISDVILYYEEDSRSFFSKFVSYQKESSTYLYGKVFDNIYINVIVRLWSYAPWYDYFYDKHPEAKHVSVGHCACYATYDGPDFYQENRFYKGDKLLFVDDYVYRGTDERILNLSVIIGAPSYDFWWRKILKKMYQNEMKSINTFEGKKILILIPEILPENLSENEKNVFKLFLQEYGIENYILVKFHPRQSEKSIANFINSLSLDKKINLHFSKVPTVVLASVVQCAVAFGWTTAAVDAIVNDVPVIEVNDGRQCLGCGSLLENYAMRNKEFGSFYRINDLAIYAKTYKALCTAVDGVLNNKLWEDYRGRYKKFFLLDNRAGERMAVEIMKLAINDVSKSEYRCNE